MDLYFIVIFYNLQIFTILVYLLQYFITQNKTKSREKEFSVEEKAEVGLWTRHIWIKVRTLEVGKTGKEERSKRERSQGELAGEEPHTG